jgi:hypothetical protein
MKIRTITILSFILFLFSCESDEQKLNKEVNEFKQFSDSLLNYNNYYVEVLYGDTQMIDIVDPSNPELRFNDIAVVHHSNIFDTTTEYFKNSMASSLNKYLALELKLDTMQALMNEKLLKSFKETKTKVRNIMKPIN